MTKRIPLDIFEHKNSGWLLATAEELPGFMVQAGTLEELKVRIPRVLKRYFKRRDDETFDVTIADEHPAPSGYGATRVFAEFEDTALASA
ncbi:MAG: hypothetical protein H2040_12565 [Euryhalocaulis sp.]|uniref:hypothetical protein n=1 Tax=Euryhalocaulis sp. TaxID=2744307 RepID=UPI001849A8FF|nr:hypothetical protein [Euryhalocaulis sp.]MBA4802685.1 hypothetical protein [Euryhalocaulis sp.]